jgi:hypothetical protein
MKTYAVQLEDFRQNVLDYILRTVQNKKVQFAYDEETIYDLPCHSTTGRHDDHIDFAIVAVSKKGIHTVGLGEVDGQKETFDWIEVTIGEIVSIADKLS